MDMFSKIDEEISGFQKSSLIMTIFEINGF